MSEIAEVAAETAADMVEETIDGVVDVMEVVRNNPKVLVLVGLLGLAAGGAGGYFFAKKQLKEYYEQLATEEIADAKAFYAGVYKTDEDGAVLTPQEVLSKRHGAEAAAEAVRIYRGEGPELTEADLIAAAKDLQGSPYDDVQDEELLAKTEKKVVVKEDDKGVYVEEKTETRSVWDGPTFDLDEEVKLRTETKPYIITSEEYFAAEKEYETSSLTYYEEDDTLVDEQDAPMNDIDKIVGDDHLVRFGTASGDANIVYVRNDRLETDYEIVRSPGSYVKEVLGMLDSDATSLKHSNRNAQLNRRREFRHGDG